MATKIEWADESWQPIVGCERVSAGCSECYAEKMANRICGMKISGNDILSEKYNSVIDFITHKWNGEVYFDEGSLQKPYQFTKPKRIFVCSMGDLFHQKVKSEWLEKIFGVIKMNPQHTFIILTKRPEIALIYSKDVRIEKYFRLPNILFGVTAENQAMADRRIPVLMEIPAVRKFVSIEPMLGSIELQNRWKDGLNWVICGGMSGSNKYPLNPEWVRNLQKQCFVSYIPFLFKQWGGLKKKAAGRLLDGKLFDEYPEPYEFHVLFTDKTGQFQEKLKKGITLLQVEEWLVEIKAQYWEIGIPKNFKS